MDSVSPARRAAFNILNAIETGRSHSDELLRGRNVAKLSEADRGLTTALVLGVLRWQIELDQHIRPLLKHPNAKLDTEVLIALRMGAFQMLRMDRIPARAAIDESVELAKQAGHRFASGMVNAVLRKIAAKPKVQAPLESIDECRHAYPEWLVQRWVTLYGEEAACAICQRGQAQPRLTIRLAGDVTDAELVSEGIAVRPGELLRAAREVVGGDVTAIAGFREGRVRIQDEGSQLIAELVPRGGAILDCCAAPGGKTLILAERNPESRIVACESNPQRLAHMRDRLSPLGERVQSRLADATAIEDDAAFDVALADVPCSGTGTLGRNPEIRHRFNPEDLQRQAERQRGILRAALRAVRPGGHVLYSTCSLEPEENEQVVCAVLAECADARLVPMQSRMEELRAEGALLEQGVDLLLNSITADGMLRLLPGVSGMDGFFAALIQRDA
jgi:16S rRNA (cytosine967-C5)-methyltransferase